MIKSFSHSFITRTASIYDGVISAYIGYSFSSHVHINSITFDHLPAPSLAFPMNILKIDLTK